MYLSIQWSSQSFTKGRIQGYYRAAHSLARTARSMSRKLWRPATDSDGIPLETLSSFYQALRDWRAEFLEQVTVHMNDYSGDFLTVSE